MKKLLLATALIVPILTACVPKPKILTMAEIQQMDYGAYPKNYEQIVYSYLSRTLREPETAKVNNITKPQKYLEIREDIFADYGDDGWRPIYYTTGYAVCTQVNAKNGYGGYSGWRRYQFLIKNGKIIDGDVGAACDSTDEIFIRNDVDYYKLEIMK